MSTNVGQISEIKVIAVNVNGDALYYPHFLYPIVFTTLTLLGTPLHLYLSSQPSHLQQPFPTSFTG